MLHPSYMEMIEKMNETRTEEDMEIQSRYSLVIAAAKRARQINAGSEPLIDISGQEKNLSIAVDELFNGKVHILEHTDAVSEMPEEEILEEDTADEDAADDEDAEEL